MRLLFAIFGRRSLPIAALALLLSVTASDARAAYPMTRVPTSSSAVQAGTRAGILAVLQERIGDPALIRKAETKLAAMDGAEIRLIARLCDRITPGRDGFAADVAFLLVSALVLFS